MGFSYDERKKSYFSDRHEDEGNKTCRKKFIKEYFELEKRTYRWIQIGEKLAKNFEEEEDSPLLKKSFYEYKKKQ